MSPEPIIASTARAHGYGLPDLIRQDRSRPLAWVRQDAMRAAYDAGATKYAIAHAIRRDCATVRHGIRQSMQRAQEAN